MVRYNGASKDEIYKSLLEQAKGTPVTFNCPTCQREISVDAADVLSGGKETECVHCKAIFKLTGPADQ